METKLSPVGPEHPTSASQEIDFTAIGGTLDHLDQYLVCRFLHSELERRRMRNSKYSQRAMARDLGLSSGDLSKVMRGMKFLSAETVARLAQTLQLPPAQSRALLVSAALGRLREKNLWM